MLWSLGCTGPPHCQTNCTVVTACPATMFLAFLEQSFWKGGPEVVSVSG